MIFSPRLSLWISPWKALLTVCVTVVVGATRFTLDILVRVLVVFFAFAPNELVVVAADGALALEAFVVAVVTPESSSGLSNKCLSSDEWFWITCTSAGDNRPVDVVVPVVACFWCVVWCATFCCDVVVPEVFGNEFIVAVEV